jgi:hypothetical protein
MKRGGPLFNSDGQLYSTHHIIINQKNSKKKTIFGLTFYCSIFILIISFFLIWLHIKYHNNMNNNPDVKIPLTNLVDETEIIENIPVIVKTDELIIPLQPPIEQLEPLLNETLNLPTYDMLIETGNLSALDSARIILDRHSIHKIDKDVLKHMAMDEVMLYISTQPQCKNIPLFATMASVGSDLYWQLIENFIYTMVKFGLSDCTIMICVTDLQCMSLCQQSGFPCFSYRYDLEFPDVNLPSAMEQIGILKLFHMPKALLKGVDMFVVDLDVGFLENPLKLMKDFIKNPKIDVFVQHDISFVMNRTREGWRTWYVVPLPNIGLMLTRGNVKTSKMFDFAWKDYNTIVANIKHNPGKDQNKVVRAMQYSTNYYKLHWKYFPESSAVLLDKIYKFEKNKKQIELGGEATSIILKKRGAIAVHTTCYEQKTKVMGLKAASAFWNPRYYDPNTRTITKKLLFSTPAELEQEVLSLVYLAIVTNRTLIIPNILGEERLSIVRTVDPYKNLSLWPGFRVAFFKNIKRKMYLDLNIKIAEPSFYWRIKRDYSKEIPEANVLFYNQDSSLRDIEKDILTPKNQNLPRLIIHVAKNNKNNNNIKIINELNIWSSDSVGSYNNYRIESFNYIELPKLIDVSKKNLWNQIRNEVRLCKKIFYPMQGNRSCFDKCD